MKIIYSKARLPKLEDCKIFGLIEGYTEPLQVFDICNFIGRFYSSDIVQALNDEPIEGKKVAKNIEYFFIDSENFICAATKGKNIRFLRNRLLGRTMLGKEEEEKFIKTVLEEAVVNLNNALSKVKQTLKFRMLTFREQTDSIFLNRDQYVLIMCDGCGFSKLIKNRFKLPFDQDFIGCMNYAAIETSKHLQGFKVAYTQSDEISFLLHRGTIGSPYFDYRLNKIVSVVSSLVSVHFMAAISSLGSWTQIIGEEPAVFDGRAFNLPTENDAFAYLLWRQNDCVRNSKQQAAQTYFKHKELANKNTDEQIKLLKEQVGIDWEDYRDGEKYGRLIYKEKVTLYNSENEPYTRTIWKAEEVKKQFGDELRERIRIDEGKRKDN